MLRIFFCLLLLTGLAAAETKSFQAGNTHVLMTLGHPNQLEATTSAPTTNYVKILGQTSSGKNCKARRLPNLVVIEPATHGRLCFRDETMPVRYTKHDDEGCLGADELFRVVYFRPRDHFVGADSFRYSVSYQGAAPTGVIHDSLTLTPSPSPAPPSDGAAVPEAAQKAGPLPPCVQVVM